VPFTSGALTDSVSGTNTSSAINPARIKIMMEKITNRIVLVCFFNVYIVFPSISFAFSIRFVRLAINILLSQFV